MQTYYDVLQVETEASQAEIKRAFRRRAKELHPDVAASQNRSVEEMRLLIQAYETLIDPELRQEYDRTHFIVPSRFRFDYREFLKNRPDDMVSQSKLIFFDLLHGHEQEALDLFDSLTARGGFDLAEYLDREDFMDCTFLLAEEYERRAEYLKAYELLVTLISYERERPYFRHFFREVVDRLRSVVCFRMSATLSSDVVLSCIEELIEQDLSRKDTAYYYKKAAEIHLEHDRITEAISCVDSGLEYDSKLHGLKKLRERIELVASLAGSSAAEMPARL